MDNNYYSYTTGGVLRYNAASQSKSHKKLFIILAIVLTIIIAIGSLAWLLFFNLRWKIYSSEGYGIKMQYPNNWDYYHMNNDEIMFTRDGDIIFAPNDIINSLKEVPGSVNGKSLNFILRHYWKNEYELYIQSILSVDDEYGNVSTTSIAIDGVNGIGYFSEALVEFPGISKGDVAVDYVIPYRNGYLDFGLFDYSQFKTFEKIISSVRLSSKSINSAEDCDNMQDQEDKDICYFNLSMDNLDEELCNEIQDPINQKNCADEVYASLVMSSLQPGTPMNNEMQELSQLKAADEWIKSSLLQVRDVAQMEYIDNKNTFSTVCAGNGLNAAEVEELAKIANDIVKKGGATVCYATSSAYCAYSELRVDVNMKYCIDSTGVAYATTTIACSDGHWTCN